MILLLFLALLCLFILVLLKSIVLIYGIIYFGVKYVSSGGSGFPSGHI